MIVASLHYHLMKQMMMAMVLLNVSLIALVGMEVLQVMGRIANELVAQVRSHHLEE